MPYNKKNMKKMEIKSKPCNLNALNSNDHESPRECPTNRVFLSALWKAVEDPVTNDVICWDPSDVGCFLIKNLEKFKTQTLPIYYSAKWNSFRRQLYFYGFKATRDVVWRHLDLDHTDAKTFNSIQRVKQNSHKRKMDELYQNFGLFSSMFPPHAFQNAMMANPFALPPHVASPGISPPNAYMSQHPQMPAMPSSLANFLPKSNPNEKLQKVPSPTLLVPPNMMPMMPFMSPRVFVQSPTIENALNINIPASSMPEPPLKKRKIQGGEYGRPDFLKSKSVEVEMAKRED